MKNLLYYSPYIPVIGFFMVITGKTCIHEMNYNYFIPWIIQVSTFSSLFLIFIKP